MLYKSIGKAAKNNNSVHTIAFSSKERHGTYMSKNKQQKFTVIHQNIKNIFTPVQTQASCMCIHTHTHTHTHTKALTMDNIGQVHQQK